MIPLAEIGTLALSGHRLRDCQLPGLHHLICHCISPFNIGGTRIESQVKPALAIREHSNVHNQTLIGNGCISFQMEQHCHVVPVVRGIKASDIDGAPAQAVSEVTRVERWLPIVCEIHRLAVRVCVCQPSCVIILGRLIGCASSKHARKAEQDRNERQQCWPESCDHRGR